MTAAPTLSLLCRQHRQRRDTERARIMAQLRQLGYRPRDWAEAERIAARLTRKH